jgi:hypothetical protein
VDVPVLYFLLGGRPDTDYLHIKIQLLAGERVVAIDGHLIALD